MHAEQHKGHGQQVEVLPVNDVPLVGGHGLVDVNVGEEAEGEDHDAEVDPREDQHTHEEGGDGLVLGNVCLDVTASAGHEDVAGVVDDEDHDPGRDLVAHEGEQDEGCGHEVVKHPLVVLLLVVLGGYKVEDGEDVHAQLEAEVDLQLAPLARRPVGVLPVDLRT